MRVRVRIDTLTDARDFVAAVLDANSLVYLEDGAGQKVNAKSLLGALCSMEFDEIWCTCNIDISGKIVRFMI